MPQRYLDDFTLGEVFKSSPHILSDKHFAAFAAMTGDAHPLHYDSDYARAKGWDAPLAHGRQVAALHERRAAEARAASVRGCWVDQDRRRGWA